MCIYRCVCRGNWIGYLTFAIDAVDAVKCVSSEWVKCSCAKCTWCSIENRHHHGRGIIIIIIIWRNDANKICEKSAHTRTHDIIIIIILFDGNDSVSDFVF